MLTRFVAVERGEAVGPREINSVAPSMLQGMEYRKNIEGRRADQEMSDAKQNTFNPAICKQSAVLYSDSTPAYERLLNKQAP